MSTDLQTIHAALSDLLERRHPDAPSTVLGAGSDDLAAGRRYLERLVRGGWMVPTWPSRFGGRDADGDEAARIDTALTDYEAADLYPYGVGLSLVGPVLLDQGSVGQQDRWLRAIADGSEIWCQMFLSLTPAPIWLTRHAGRTDGDEWVLNGSKVWTSRGAYALWGDVPGPGTDVSVAKHRGLTMFAVDMGAPGCGGADPGADQRRSALHRGVRDRRSVPDTDRIGDLGAGWGITVETLAHERATIGGRAFGGGDSEGVWSTVVVGGMAGGGWLDDPVARQAAMRALSCTG
ncbi:MAG: hypothetical protein Ct9H300mP31_18990 [Acidimicrobiaceae bacterium]|nr:MAG: hypothetical protein Ct9H300mP31_18990 [Acidimicrobiaceae bacterium]